VFVVLWFVFCDLLCCFCFWLVFCPTLQGPLRPHSRGLTHGRVSVSMISTPASFLVRPPPSMKTFPMLARLANIRQGHWFLLFGRLLLKFPRRMGGGLAVRDTLLNYSAPWRSCASLFAFDFLLSFSSPVSVFPFGFGLFCNPGRRPILHVDLIEFFLCATHVRRPCRLDAKGKLTRLLGSIFLPNFWGVLYRPISGSFSGRRRSF